MTELKNTMLFNQPAGFSPPKMEEYPSPGEPGGSKSYNKGVGKYESINEGNILALDRAQRSPEQMKNFQAAMAKSSQLAYNQRQAQELSSLSFDPSKVSGSFFHDVISNLEGERSQDTSKIYQANMSKYRGVQEEIAKRKDYLQELANQKREYMMNYRLDKESSNKLLTGKKEAMKRLKKEKEEFNRQYIQSLQKAGKDTSYMDFTADEIRQSIMAMAERNHSMGAIEDALNQVGVPTFQGSLAGNYLIDIFNGLS